MIDAFVGAAGIVMTVTVAVPETLETAAATLALPADVAVNCAPVSVVSAVIVPFPVAVQLNVGWVASGSRPPAGHTGYWVRFDSQRY